MSLNTTMSLCLALPLIGTTLGSALALVLRREMGERLQSALMGFASGVMIAASVWSLLIPAAELAEKSGGAAWLPAAVGFLLGVGFLLLLDRLMPHLHFDSELPEGPPSRLKRSIMLIFAVTLHNLPEGMAVGVVMAGLRSGAGISAADALALAAGIAIQNFPEGAIISMPLVSSGLTRRRAFRYGFLSGVVEPVGAVLTVLLTALVLPVLPYLLAFAAGAMIYVVIEELVPQSHCGGQNDIGTIGAALGFAVMMTLDIALG